MKNFCRMAFSISAVFVFSSCTEKFEALPSAYLDLPADAIIGGYVEENQKIHSQVYRFQHLTNPGVTMCTGMHMEDGSILTAAHCLNHAGERKELAAFFANEASTFIANAALYPLGKKASEESFYENDIAVALVPPANSETLLSGQGFKFPKTNELPEELYISGYGETEFETTGPEGRPLKSVKLSRSKQELKTVTEKNTGAKYKKAVKDIALVNKLLKSSKIRCFKSVDTRKDLPYIGDSGGPLYSLDADGAPILHGVFSIFVGPADQTHFFCYTNVFSYTEKIQQLQKSSAALLFQNKLNFRSEDGSLVIDSQILDDVSTAQRSFTGTLIDVGYAQIQELQGIDLKDKVALVARGGIPFYEKVENLKAAGAEAIVFYNNSDDDQILFSLNGSSYINLVDQADIRMISKKHGEALSQWLKAGKTVEATLTITPQL